MARRKTRVRRGRGVSGRFNTKLFIDVLGASLVVNLLPKLVEDILPLDPSMYAVAGAGGGFVLGKVLKRPDLSTSAIALGAVSFVEPFVDDIFQKTSGMLSPAVTPGVNKIMPPVKQAGYSTASDYFRLNAYVGDPSAGRQNNYQYRDSY